MDGTCHRLPSGHWCNLCGVCCQIGGILPDPPTGVVYPDHWVGLLSGDTLENQQLCPFLFQYLGEPRFFCAIHNIKPVTCRVFDREDCRRRLQDRGLHGDVEL
ncbi:MAG: YkgJ family cysteine cluster protein [Deltaproteobacteria bacterium]|nr:YkgJ family cysteine cluster protein [Deltaproteobacteria bacterium]MBW2680761.1 YkgJ family cysteine cluster protein [Deltaproteobacteria bacterium]